MKFSFVALYSKYRRIPKEVRICAKCKHSKFTPHNDWWCYRNTDESKTYIDPVTGNTHFYDIRPCSIERSFTPPGSLLCGREGAFFEPRRKE